MVDVFNKLDWKLVLRTRVKFVDLQWSAGFVKFYPFIKACHIFFLRENARNDFQCLWPLQVLQGFNDVTRSMVLILLPTDPFVYVLF